MTVLHIIPAFRNQQAGRTPDSRLHPAKEASISENLLAFGDWNTVTAEHMYVNLSS
jgi:hypothetical protein